MVRKEHENAIQLGILNTAAGERHSPATHLGLPTQRRSGTELELRIWPRWEWSQEASMDHCVKVTRLRPWTRGRILSIR